MPAQMSLATDVPSGAVAAACSWYVIQRNAPGAISAIAFIVTPVSPRVGFTVAVPVLVSAMDQSPFRRSRGRNGRARGAEDLYGRLPRIHALRTTRRGARGAGAAPKSGMRPRSRRQSPANENA